MNLNEKNKWSMQRFAYADWESFFYSRQSMKRTSGVGISWQIHLDFKTKKRYSLRS
jgi:hypothetical protein